MERNEWQAIVQRAQKHGWRPAWVDPFGVIVEKKFRSEGKAKSFFVHWDGTIVILPF